MPDDAPPEIEKEPVRKIDWPPLFFGFVLMVAYFAITSFIIHHGIPDGASSYITELVTTLRDAFMLFIMYLYGTNAASAHKTNLLSKAPPIKE